MSENHLPLGEEPRRLPRPGFLAAVLFLVLVLAAGVFVATRGHSGSSPPSPGAALPTEATASSAASSGSGANAVASGGCRPADTSQAVPVTAPGGVTWTLYDTVALPVSAAAGPDVIEGDVASCFAHTPAGALMAAAQISTRYLVAQDWRTVLADSVVPGPGARAYASARAKVTVGAQSGDFGQFAGFQFVAYSPQVAVIQLVARFGNGVLQMVTATVVWSGGDWRLQLQSSGAMGANAQVLPNLIGFVLWGGV